jgi:hypothetical protein
MKDVNQRLRQINSRNQEILNIIKKGHYHKVESCLWARSMIANYKARFPRIRLTEGYKRFRCVKHGEKGE